MTENFSKSMSDTRSSENIKQYKCKQKLLVGIAYSKFKRLQEKNYLKKKPEEESTLPVEEKR